MQLFRYGQMTAGSFCYIGPQGIVHGTTVSETGTFESITKIMVRSVLYGKYMSMTCFRAVIISLHINFITFRYREHYISILAMIVYVRILVGASMRARVWTRACIRTHQCMSVSLRSCLCVCVCELLGYVSFSRMCMCACVSVCVYVCAPVRVCVCVTVCVLVCVCVCEWLGVCNVM